MVKQRHFVQANESKAIVPHPIENVLSRLKKVRQLPGDGRYSACCPAHQDSEPSLSVWEDGPDHVGIMCQASCSHAAILGGAGLTWRDLYRQGTVPDLPEGGISLADLAQDKLIHPTFLHNLGCREGVYQNKRAVIFPYRNAQGHSLRERARFALKATDGTRWLKGEKQYAYGLDRLEDARKASYLVIVEGESDCWTLWQSGFPALGVPGVANYKVLDLTTVEGFARIYISQEPPSEKDLAAGKDPGAQFVADVTKRLTALGYQGQLYALPWQDLCGVGVKDPNALLHKTEPKGFKAAFEAALQQARLCSSAPAAPDSNQGKQDGEQLPDIFCGGQQLREHTLEVLASLAARERVKPSLFVRSGKLCRIVLDEDQRPMIAQLGEAEMRNEMTHAANYYRLKELKDGQPVPVPIPPPTDYVRAVLAANPAHIADIDRALWPFRPLAGIIEAPTMRPDGTIIVQPGYDAATRLYYQPSAGLGACQVPETPTSHDVQQALNLLWDSFGEFAYADQADQANALAMLLTPLIRPLVTRHIPLALLNAPKAGTGKGLLADCLSLIATGRTAMIMTAPEDEQEWDKRITAMLLAGKTVVVIDNIPDRLRSSKLDAVLTSDFYEGRLLGRSATIDLPNRATWIATGNNVRLGGDLARRSYQIRLDPHTARPWLRSGFKHADLATHVAQTRGKHIAALLTLARAWIVAGRPFDASLPTLGTFTSWVQVVGGILHFAGVEGFLGNLEQFYSQIDEEAGQWEAFLQAWIDLFKSDWIEAGQVAAHLYRERERETGGGLFSSAPVPTSADPAKLAGSSDFAGSCLADFLPPDLQTAMAEKPIRSFAIRLARALEKRLETCYGESDLHIERAIDKHSKMKRWRVVAGSSSPLRPKKSETDNMQCNNGKKNNIYNGGENYPQLPASENTEIGQNGSTGGTSTDFDSSSVLKQLPAKEQLPANAKSEYSEVI